MIKKIIIQDFFSFKGKNEIELNSDINILLGINGSGKTSFLNAFRLLYEGISGIGFETLFQNQWGGFHQVANVNKKEAEFIKLTYVFDHETLKKINTSSPFESDVYYNISIYPSGTSYYIKELLYTEKKGKRTDNFTYLDFVNGNGKLSIRYESEGIKFEDYRDGEVSGQELVLRQITDPLRYLPSYTLKKAIDNMSIYGHFDTNSSSPLRLPTNEFVSSKLRKSGDNLASLLNYLKNNRTLIYDKIEKNLSKINPAYKSIEFSLYGSQIYLSLKEKDLDKTIGALHLSDGTLGYLLLMTIFCNPNRGFLVGVDEPECGLHPDMIKSICDMMKESSESQIIVATHSPLLLNHFDLEDILVFEKDEQNETVVKRLNEDDFPDWEGDFLPGQMWLRGQIGGKRW
jgi:predicted ATPase